VDEPVNSRPTTTMSQKTRTGTRSRAEGDKSAENRNDGHASQPLWNGYPVRPKHPAPDGEPFRQKAARIAAPQVPADAAGDVTEERNSVSSGHLRQARTAADPHPVVAGQAVVSPGK
jgi:hypothetical protein